MHHGRKPLCTGICKPLITLQTKADIAAETDLFGKVVADLQTGITVGTDAITGTLKHVTGYTGFSGDPDLQSGNYLALHITCEEADSISVLLDPTEGSGEVTLDDDGIIVLRVEDKDTQVVKVTAHKTGTPDYTKVYSLTGLMCQEE